MYPKYHSSPCVPLISHDILHFQSSQGHIAISGFLCQYHCALMHSVVRCRWLNMGFSLHPVPILSLASPKIINAAPEDFNYQTSLTAAYSWRNIDIVRHITTSTIISEIKLTTSFVWLDSSPGLIVEGKDFLSCISSRIVCMELAHLDRASREDAETNKEFHD